MKRLGPLSGSGPGSVRKSRVPWKRSRTRSDTGCASPTSLSSTPLPEPTASPPALLAGTALTVVLRARGRSRFDVWFGETQIVKSSAQSICDAARVLHRLGYADDCRMAIRHEGADHHAISGLLGYWRKRRIREDRGMPRYVAWEPRPRRVEAKKSPGKFKSIRLRTKNKNSSTTNPGAIDGHSAPLVPMPCGPSRTRTRSRSGFQ